MHLGSSREFWEVKVLKAKGNICPLISIFRQPRAVCNKGAENRVEEERDWFRRKEERTLETGNVRISMASSVGSVT